MAKVKVDAKGVKEILNSRKTADAVRDAARQVAANVDARGRPVETRDYTTDRAASSVSIAHPTGLGMQAKYGALTRAAAAAGLEVKARR